METQNSPPFSTRHTREMVVVVVVATVFVTSVVVVVGADDSSPPTSPKPPPHRTNVFSVYRLLPKNHTQFDVIRSFYENSTYLQAGFVDLTTAFRFGYVG
uniref:Secreted protein n=1 Tax=Angiostrongylus cantonensis TaxID=6313 RepID=A0A0K0DHD5_ANGCA